VTSLLLLRHGESAWNAVGRWQGHADPPLSARGVEEARRIVGVLAGVSRVVSSDLRRARQTAELIATGLSLGSVEVFPDLRERDVGEWSGLTNEEVDGAYPGYRAAGRVPPGWESDELMLTRVVPALQRLDGPDGVTVVVTHGGVLRLVEAHLGGPTRPQSVANLQGRYVESRDGVLHLGEEALLLGG
jgi:broad specificity phosphatase PhoE